MKNKVQTAFAILLTVTGAAFALTGGPVMPEYTSFDDVSSSNLVNQTTGNFSYTIPLMDVPGPEGSYPISMSYHSGITHGQEASWVGLGWTLNPGAINRSLRGVPDDYLNSVVASTTQYYKEGTSINVNLGLGPFGLAMGWDLNSGKFSGPSASLRGSLGTYGFNVGSKGLSIAGNLDFGVGSISKNLYNSNGGANDDAQPVWALNGQISRRISASQPPIAGPSPSFGLNGSSSSSGNLSSGRLSSQSGGAVLGYGAYRIGIGLTNWQYELYDVSTDYLCGFLFQNVANNSYISRRIEEPLPYQTGTDSKKRQRFERTKIDGSLYLSSDLYQAAASGMGGTFEPYLEPEKGTGNSVPTVQDGDPWTVNNDGWNFSNQKPLTEIVFRMTDDQGYNLYQEQTKNTVDAMAPEEFNPSQLLASGFNKQQQYGATRIEPIFEEGPTSFLSRLMGFVITNTEGVRYEYLQPVNSLFQVDYVFEDPNRSLKNRNEKVMPDKYATTWLLTAVKGADYTDLAQAGMSDDDLGHWVKFEYTAPKTTTWSAPYQLNMPMEQGEKVSANGSKLYSKTYGRKELVYLSTISTRTHYAKFTLADRLDAQPSRNNPWTSNLEHHNGIWEGDLWGGYIDAFEKNVPLWSGNQATAPDVYYTTTFPGDWVSPCKIYAELNANAYPPGSPYPPDSPEWKWRYDVYTNECIKTDYFVNQYPRYGNGCKNLHLNSKGDTEADCSFKGITVGDGSNVTSIRLASAKIDWVNLEAARYPAKQSAIPQVLTRVELFSKAIPEVGFEYPNSIKIVDFKYDYSLCGNTPNSTVVPNMAELNKAYYLQGTSINKGKLTLKKIEFTGRMNYRLGPEVPSHDGPKAPPYEFTYQSGSAGNPQFGNEMLKDVWGMYSPTGVLDRHLTDQSPTFISGVWTGGENVGVCWNLSGIRIPTGGHISVNYKRDSYFMAGLAKDASNGNQIALPDIFNITAATTLNSKTLDVTALPKFQHSTATAPNRTTFPNLIQVGDNTHGFSANEIQVKTPGPAGEEDFVSVTSIPTNFSQGDFAYVVYDFWERQGLPTAGAWRLKMRGVMNLVSIQSITQSPITMKLQPIMFSKQWVANGPNKFFLYKDFRVQETGSNQAFDYKFDYYLLPVKANSERKFYGGDVAVSDITMGDGMGNTYKTNFDYGAKDIRTDGVAAAVSNYNISSGATYGLPPLYWEKFYRFWGGDYQPENLRFEPWPRFKTGSIGICQGVSTSCANVVLDPVTKVSTVGYAPPGFVNPVSDWVNKAYFSNYKTGGYYFPGPGVTYSRVTTENVSPNPTNGSVSGWAGSTESQFYNLAYKFLHEGVPFDGAQATKGLEYNNWTAIKGTQKLDILAGSLSQAGMLMRSLDWRENKALGPVHQSINQYATRVVAHLNSTTNTMYPLGMVKQTHGSKIGSAATEVISATRPHYSLERVSTIHDGVRSDIYTQLFDSKSGNPLVTIKQNSDGSVLKEELVPLYDSPGLDIGKHNRSSLIQRKVVSYSATPSGPNGPDYKVINSTQYIWSTLPKKSARNAPVGGALYKSKTLEWDPALDASGIPVTPFVIPVLTNGLPQSPWKITESVSAVNDFSLPLERHDPYQNTYFSEYTGYNSNFVIARASNVKHSEAAFFTGDYDNSQREPGFFDKANGWRKNSSISSVGIFWNHCGVGSVTFSGDGPSVRVSADPVRHPKYIFSVHMQVAWGPIKLILQPYSSSLGRNVGQAVVVEVHHDPNGYWQEVYAEIDLTRAEYESTDFLDARIGGVVGQTNASADNFRLHPKNSMVTTHFYDADIGKLVATIDESGTRAKVKYDGFGRPVKVMNHQGKVVSEATYENISNAR